MPANANPQNPTGGSSPLNPSTYKTFNSSPDVAVNNAAPQPTLFFFANIYETEAATPANAYDSSPLRSFEFITNQLTGGKGIGQ